MSTAESKRRLRYQKSYSVEIQRQDSRRDSLIADANFESKVNQQVERSMEEEEQEASSQLKMKRFTTIVKLSTDSSTGAAAVLQQLLALLAQQHSNIQLLHMESRSSSNSNSNNNDTSVDIDNDISSKLLTDALLTVKCSDSDYSLLLQSMSQLTCVSTVVKDNPASAKPDVWFPRHISELDECTHLLLKFQPELATDHPGFHDSEYRQRRNQVVEIAFNYRFGDPIPRVEYTKQEQETWRHAYTTLKKLYETHACDEHMMGLKKLELECGYGPHAIPQLEDISKYLRKTTGWSLRPVAGLLSARDFLASLAFRVFQCTQYIRHHSKPLHTPEPDCIHEIIGHMPMLTNPGFAEFSQEIGLASLGATDDEIKRLATLYWFTVEFGLCRQNGQLRAYGAGLLSAYGELQHALSDTPQHREFEPNDTAATPYTDEEYQPLYFVTNSFDKMKDEFRKYVQSMKKGFVARFDPVTQRIVLLDNKDALVATCDTIQRDLMRLQLALNEFL